MRSSSEDELSWLTTGVYANDCRRRVARIRDASPSRSWSMTAIPLGVLENAVATMLRERIRSRLRSA